MYHGNRYIWAHKGWDWWLGLQTLEMLEKKEKLLQKKIALEIEKARDYTRAKNKRGIFFCGYSELP